MSKIPKLSNAIERHLHRRAAQLGLQEVRLCRNDTEIDCQSPQERLFAEVAENEFPVVADQDQTVTGAEIDQAVDDDVARSHVLELIGKPVCSDHRGDIPVGTVCFFDV
jgi:hypothetical protein